MAIELSSRLAEEFRYPLTDVWNLPRVAQYIATSFGDSQFAKGKMADLILDCEKRPLVAPPFPGVSGPRRVAQQHRRIGDPGSR